MSTESPQVAWQHLDDGNRRFLDGRPEHPHQGLDRRRALADGQSPVATVLACSDSRVAPELLFDQGLGDLFTIRNAGHIVGDGEVASIEYGVAMLHTPVVVVLAHDRCGAVRAAVDGEAPDAPALPPIIAAHVAPIRASVEAARRATPEGPLDADAVASRHLEASIARLLAASEIVSAAVADGSLAVIGAQYRLAEGRVERLTAVGLA